MNEVGQKISFGVGSAAAAAAIFAPIDYKWKGVLSAVAASGILSGIYGTSTREKAREMVSDMA